MTKLAAIVATLCTLANTPAHAIVGDAAPADESVARHVVLILGQEGKRRGACTGTALARDLVLTADHCIPTGGSANVLVSGKGRESFRTQAAKIERHPDAGLSRADTVDLALLKLSQKLPDRIVPAALATRTIVLVGERFVVAGYGVSGTREFGVLRMATLMATRRLGERLWLLTDPTTRGQTGGLGVCSGDSGGPVFDLSSGRLKLVAVIRSATDARGAGGCGGLSGATPIEPYREWILETAKKLGSAVGP